MAEALPLTGDEHAVLCVLLLRGAQTPGELKQRTDRMHAFADLDAVHDTLERLIARELVMRLDRRPGQKEERYEHLLSADVDEAGPIASPVSAPYASRVHDLDHRSCAPRRTRVPGGATDRP